LTRHAIRNRSFTVTRALRGIAGPSDAVDSNQEEDDVDDDSRISYFFLGLGLGVAAGVLFAPKAGPETRQLLRSKAEEGADYVRSKAEEGADYVKRRGEELRETATETLDRGKQTIQRHKENLNAAVEAGKQAYRESVKATPAE
jgi:gas vesicle protein